MLSWTQRWWTDWSRWIITREDNRVGRLSPVLNSLVVGPQLRWSESSEINWVFRLLCSSLNKNVLEVIHSNDSIIISIKPFDQVFGILKCNLAVVISHELNQRTEVNDSIDALSDRVHSQVNEIIEARDFSSSVSAVPDRTQFTLYNIANENSKSFVINFITERIVIDWRFHVTLEVWKLNDAVTIIVVDSHKFWEVKLSESLWALIIIFQKVVKVICSDLSCVTEINKFESNMWIVIRTIWQHSSWLFSLEWLDYLSLEPQYRREQFDNCLCGSFLNHLIYVN